MGMPIGIPIGRARVASRKGGGMPIGNGRDAYRDADGDAYRKGEGWGCL